MDSSNTSLLDEMLVNLLLMLSGIFSSAGGVVALLVDIGTFIISLHEWLVAPVCEVEGHIKKVDDLLVSFDCDFKDIQFEHLADFLLGFFNFFCSGLANCEAIVTVQTDFIFEFWCYQG